MGSPYCKIENKSSKASAENGGYQYQGKGSQAMIARQIASLIGSVVVFLETSGDDIVDPDAAVQLMEVICGDIEELDKRFLRELVDAFELVASDYSGETAELVRRIPHYFYLEEVLAVDDPIRLAELEALRGAMD
ncbi:hypothetical protein [Sphingomonas sp. CARO-RG-8B-R24-01]|uniref:hypothetical protein n=1 Tax=Sphingomonas sp. CARO-RG-8B-R24-01 TaxID=2914831 RepID=UPI001F565537|nr:hypothetical protein [Sphingomonas sp. CARO-RG-8B-R24-01]